MKLSKKHINAVGSLINLYRSVSIEEIKETRKRCINYWETASELTGFGTDDCMLCMTALFCSSCIHNVVRGDSCGCHKTYDAIKYSKSAKGLKTALNKRANYLEKLLKKYYAKK